MKIEVSAEVRLPPERVVAALTDFSERRTEIWPGINEARYEVHEIGDTWADVTEGGPPKGIWARERYDWSQPNTVRWVVKESSFCAPGSYVEANIHPAGEGSRVDVHWERYASNMKGRMVMVTMRLFGKRILHSAISKPLNALADQTPL